MPQKKIISKYTKTLLIAVFFIATTLQVHAQKIKIDGVAVVIGKNIVLDSDIAKFKQEIELRSEGKITITDCEMLEELMQQKLLSHHAVIDSVTVSDAEVNSKVDRSIQFFTQEYGSLEKVVSAYGFNDLEDLKGELYNVQKDNILVEKEQLKITEKVDVTPEEVRLYFNGLKENGELPEFTAEIELAQIVLNSVPTEAEEARVLQELTQIRKEVIANHLSFWLDWDESVLLRRIKGSKNRPLVFRSTDQEIKKLIKKRSKVYSKAKFKINCNTLTKTEIVKRIIKIYESN